MGENASQTYQQIAQTRQRIGVLFDELETTGRYILDWRRHVRQRPLLFAAGAFAIGFIVAGGPKGLARRTYYLLRPSAKQRALENSYLRSLRETLDATLGGLPPRVAEEARDLRLLIEQTDARQKPQGTVVLQPKHTLSERVLIRVAEVAVGLILSSLIQRFLEQLNGKPQKSR